MPVWETGIFSRCGQLGQGISFLSEVDSCLRAILDSQSTLSSDSVLGVRSETALITINPINVLSGKIKDGQTIIELSACPASNDVIGLQDLYLQLDISTSNFETVVDDISSGLDPAASEYIVTSSYANGTLVRS